MWPLEGGEMCWGSHFSGVMEDVAGVGVVKVLQQNRHAVTSEPVCRS